MHRIYVKPDDRGNFVVVNDDGTGIAGQSLGKKVEDLPGGAHVIMDDNNMAHMVSPMSDGRFLTILNESEIKSYI